MTIDDSTPSAPLAPEAPAATAAAAASPVGAPVVQGPTEIVLTSAVECTEVAAGEEKDILMLGSIKCPALITDIAAQRAPVRVSAVIDRSGSMAGEKMALVKQTLRFVLDTLRPTDSFGIIAYDDCITEPFKLQTLSDGGLERALQAVDAIHVGGSTNLSGGLFAGIDQMAGREIKPDTYGGRPSGGGFGWHQQQPYQQQQPFAFQQPQASPFSFGATSNQPQQQPPLPFGAGPYQPQPQQQPSFPFGAAPYQQQPQQQASPFSFGAAPYQQQQWVPPPPPPATNPNFTEQPKVEEENSKKEATAAPKGKTVNSVWLFTDGQANAGITNPEELKAKAVEKLKDLPEPCTVYTFGFGSDHDAALLKGLADAGAGTYYFIQGTDSIAEAFADCLGGLVSVVAQDLSLRVEGLNGCTVSKALTAFPHEYAGTTAADQHASCTIRVRDMCSEEQRDIAVAVRVPRVPAPSLDGVGVVRWTLTYRNMLSERNESVSVEQRIGRPEQVSAESQVAPPQLDRQRNRVICTEALAEGRRLADAGQLPQAREVINRAIERIEKSPTHQDPLCQGLLTDLRSSLVGMQDRQNYASFGGQQMWQYSSNHEQQRGTAVYGNAMKSQMYAKFGSKPA